MVQTFFMEHDLIFVLANPQLGSNHYSFMNSATFLPKASWITTTESLLYEGRSSTLSLFFA